MKEATSLLIVSNKDRVRYVVLRQAGLSAGSGAIAHVVARIAHEVHSLCMSARNDCRNTRQGTS